MPNIFGPPDRSIRVYSGPPTTLGPDWTLLGASPPTREQVYARRLYRFRNGYAVLFRIVPEELRGLVAANEPSHGVQLARRWALEAFAEPA